MRTPVVRCWRHFDDAVLVNILHAQIADDPGWPPEHAHKLNLSDWLGGPADLGRWVATDNQEVVGHIGLGTVRGSVADAFSCATGYEPDRFAELCRTVVDPCRRGLGIAGALSRKAIKEALTRRRIPVATVLTGRGTWLEMMLNTGWQQIGDIDPNISNERLVLLLAPRKFIDALERNGR